MIFLCLLKATVNIIFDRVGKKDPITRGTEIAVNYLGIQFDVSMWLQCKSQVTWESKFILLFVAAVTQIAEWVEPMPQEWIPRGLGHPET